MKKILPILLVATVVTTSAYLTPLYPVYAENTNSITSETTLKVKPQQGSAAARLKTEKKMEREEKLLENEEAGLLKLENKIDLRRENLASKSAALKQKLARFKDKNKANRLELINTNLNDINSRKTKNMQESLDKISQILERLKSKASTISSSELDSAIAEVESQWSEASAAVEAQAAKDYTINLSTEATAASDAAAAKNALQSDLRATHTQVVEVRQALSNAISSVLSSLQGGNNGTN